MMIIEFAMPNLIEIGPWELGRNTDLLSHGMKVWKLRGMDQDIPGLECYDSPSCLCLHYSRKVQYIHSKHDKLLSNYINNQKKKCCLEGHAVSQFFVALCYKPEGRGFDSRWCHWNFSFSQSF